MQIYFKNIGNELAPDVQEAIEQKLLKLSKYVTEGKYEARLTVEVKKDSSARNSPSEWQAELNLDILGDHFNSMASSDTADKAIMAAGHDMTTELKRARAKTRSVNRRKGFFWKLFSTSKDA
jgi:ribosome-associated translation inhibitor RaiA